jgi:DNA-binding transcriptional MerR regulator
VIKEMIVKNGKAKNDDEANEKMNRMIEKYQEQVEEKKKNLQKVINAKKVEEENENKKYNEIKNEQKDVEQGV